MFDLGNLCGGKHQEYASREICIQCATILTCSFPKCSSDQTRQLPPFYNAKMLVISMGNMATTLLHEAELMPIEKVHDKISIWQINTVNRLGYAWRRFYR